MLMPACIGHPFPRPCSGWMESMVTGEKEMVIAFRGTDALSLYNWVENLRATKTDFELPYPGALPHLGIQLAMPTSP